MKALAILLGVFVLTIAAAPADATTCKQRAANCVRLGGSPANCSEPSRMATCKQSGIYTAPSGRTWEAKNR